MFPQVDGMVSPPAVPEKRRPVMPEKVMDCVFEDLSDLSCHHQLSLDPGTLTISCNIEIDSDHRRGPCKHAFV